MKQLSIKEDIEQELLKLLVRAEQMSLVITVELQPKQPLAMGNYTMVPHVREARHSPVKS